MEAAIAVTLVDIILTIVTLEWGDLTVVKVPHKDRLRDATYFDLQREPLGLKSGQPGSCSLLALLRLVILIEYSSYELPIPY